MVAGGYMVEGSNLIIIIRNIMVVIVDSIIAINSVTIYWAASRISNVVVASSIYALFKYQAHALPIGNQY